MLSDTPLPFSQQPNKQGGVSFTANVTAPGASSPSMFCLVTSSNSKGQLANVYLDDCKSVGASQSWSYMPTTQTLQLITKTTGFHYTGPQCLDWASGGSTVGQFQLPLLDSALPNKQALNSSQYTTYVSMDEKASSSLASGGEVQ